MSEWDLLISREGIVHFEPVLWFADKGTSRATTAIFKEQAVLYVQVLLNSFLNNPLVLTIIINSQSLTIVSLFHFTWNLSPLDSLGSSHDSFLSWYFIIWKDIFVEIFFKHTGVYRCPAQLIQLSMNFSEFLEFRSKITTHIWEISNHWQAKEKYKN